MSSEISQLQESLQGSGQRNEQLQSRYDEIAGQLEQEIARYQQAEELAEKTQAELNKQVQDYALQLQTLENRYRDDIAERDQASTALKKERDDVAQKLQEVTEAFQKAKKKHKLEANNHKQVEAVLQKSLDKLKQQSEQCIAEKSSEIRQLQKKLQDAGERYVQLQNCNADLTKQLEQEIDNNKQKEASWRKSYNSLEKKSEQRIAKLTSESEALRAELGEARLDIEQLQSGNDKCTEQLNGEIALRIRAENLAEKSKCDLQRLVQDHSQQLQEIKHQHHIKNSNRESIEQALIKERDEISQRLQKVATEFTVIEKRLERETPLRNNNKELGNEAAQKSEQQEQIFAQQLQDVEDRFRKEVAERDSLAKTLKSERDEFKRQLQVTTVRLDQSRKKLEQEDVRHQKVVASMQKLQDAQELQLQQQSAEPATPSSQQDGEVDSPEKDFSQLQSTNNELTSQLEQRVQSFEDLKNRYKNEMRKRRQLENQLKVLKTSEMSPKRSGQIQFNNKEEYESVVGRLISSARSVTDMVNRSQDINRTCVQELQRTQSQDFSQYLNADPKGKTLMMVLTNLSKQWNTDLSTMQDELKVLNRQVAQITEISSTARPTS